MIEAPIRHTDITFNNSTQKDGIAQEKHPLIGTEVYPVSTQIDSRAEKRLAKAQATLRTPDAARNLAFRMHNNSPTSAHRFGNEKPASAYFTIMDDELLVEWGQIDPEGNNKLHDFLNRELNTPQRVERGAIVRSGHINTVTVPGGISFRVALMDSLLEGKTVSEDDPNYPVVTSLMNAKFLVVDSGGYPVQLTKVNASKARTEKSDVAIDSPVEENVILPTESLPIPNHISAKKEKTTSGLGEKQFGHTKRRFIIETEHDIAYGRKAIRDIEEERKDLPKYENKGLMTTEEMTRRDEVLLFHRRWIQREQTAMRAEIRPMKEYRKVEE